MILLARYFRTLWGRMNPDPITPPPRRKSPELWQQWGWVARCSPSGVVYTGNFIVLGKRFPGSIEQKGNIFVAKVFKPPLGPIKKSDHGGCFHVLDTTGWVYVHYDLENYPANINSAIASVNATVHSAIEQAFARRR